MPSDDTPANTKVHEAISALLNEGEIAIQWCLVIDVAGPDATRYVAHRVGGGSEGTDLPQTWEILGLLEASAALARSAVVGSSRLVRGDEGEDET